MKGLCLGLTLRVRLGVGLGGSLLFASASVFGAPADLDPSKLPPAASTTVDFDRDIKPIFEGRCYRCHGTERPKSGFSLVDRASALKGGANGVDIVPGQSGRSPLVYYVARVIEDMEMPPSGKGEPLTPAEVGLMRAWVDQGANWSTTNAVTTKTLFSVEPTLGWITVHGNKQEFRAQTGLNDGWSGGLASFRMEERSPDGFRLNVEGKLLGGQNDYNVKATVEKTDLGFLRFGYQQFREYDDDTGGFYPPFGTPPIQPGRDLYEDVGHAWFDIGLTLPNWPKIVLGYEYQFRAGSKNTLAWSEVATAPLPVLPDAVAIDPNYKDIDEHAHILKLDLSHELWGVRLEDNFRVEFYDLDTQRFEAGATTLGLPPQNFSRYDESYRHTEAVNAFRVEKQVKDWLLLGGGYLYSKLDGDAGFTRGDVRASHAHSARSCRDKQPDHSGAGVACVESEFTLGAMGWAEPHGGSAE